MLLTVQTELSLLLGGLSADLGEAPADRQAAPVRLLAARSCDLAVVILVTYLLCRPLFLRNAGPGEILALTVGTVWTTLAVAVIINNAVRHLKRISTDSDDYVDSQANAREALWRRRARFVRRPVMQVTQTTGRRVVPANWRLSGILVFFLFLVPYFGGLIEAFLALSGIVLLAFALGVAYCWGCTRPGKTLGGLIFGLRLVRVDGTRLTLGDMTCRLLYLLCPRLLGRELL